MAVRTFYGKCNTTAEESEKVVVIESDVITSEFNFNIGDLLVVYFTYTNTVEEPTIVISNGDTEQQVSTSNDSGKFIKTRSVNVDAVGAWAAGETVIFAYTENNNEVVDNNAYWELINSAPSTEDVYGVTKLDGNADVDISEWLTKEKDFTKALSSGMLKKFYQSLIGELEPEPQPEPGPGPEPEPEPKPSLLTLYWFPAATEKEMTPLGVLSLTPNERQGITINYPLDEYIENIDRTSDLYNDGHAEGDYDIDASPIEINRIIDENTISQLDLSDLNINYLVEVSLKAAGTEEYTKYTDYVFDNTTKIISFNEALNIGDDLLIKYIPMGQSKADGEFYITNVLPKNRSLYYSDSASGSATSYAFLTPCNNENDLLLNSKDGGIKLNSVTGVEVIKDIKIIDGSLDVSNGTIKSGAITCGGITASGTINAGANLIQTSGNLKGKTIFENNVSLNQKYSGQLKIQKYSKTVSIGANTHCGHKDFDISLSGYKPVAVAGFNINYSNSNSKGDATHCFLWECFISGSRLYYSARNIHNKSVNIEIVFYVLYAKNV